MAHIHTAPGQHDHTVTGYIVRTDTPEPVALLHMHRKLNILLPVGGHIELHETPWQSISHELTEESGYNLSDLDILQPAVRIDTLDGVALHPYPIVANTHSITNDHNHSDTAYAFIATDAPSSTIGADESTDLRWLTRSQLNKLDTSEIHTNTRQVYNFIFDSAISQWDRLPTTLFSLASAPKEKQ